MRLPAGWLTEERRTVVTCQTGSDGLLGDRLLLTLAGATLQIVALFQIVNNTNHDFVIDVSCLCSQLASCNSVSPCRRAASWAGTESRRERPASCRGP